ncbi:T9SS C-terminal target domain-containing protein [Paludibacter sp. 221]|uniref:S8 family serine peptidase n=1 Tax=Paludibacter sp. 221 TaxID=2302939 RepID=UPI0013D3A1DA|nr:S8 family serine peptidase [Paludibacter sp. 221]NDV47092.1 T9SS C-terminal target domain-containing protein [Paludibacter sp. 221]
MKKILFGLLLFVSISVFAQEEAFRQGKLSPFTAHFISSANSSDQDTLKERKLQKRFAVKKSNGQDKHVSVYIELNQGISPDILTTYGVKINSVHTDINIVTAQIPAGMLETVSLLPEVKRIEIGIPVRKKMDKARIAANVDKVQAGTGITSFFDGSGVVVGVVDGGFDYTHRNFYDIAGNELRIKRVWDQNASTGTSPQGYDYGTEYKTSSAILAANYDDQKETHGTHVAGIAAGADMSNENPYYGIATAADLVFVSNDMSDQTNVTITDGIKYIYDYAEAVGKPCVVNLSLGTHVGPHDGTSFFDRTSDDMQGKGRLLVGSVGNEGKDQLHVSKTFTPTDNSLNTFFYFNYSYDRYGWADIWGEANKDYTVQVVVYKNSSEKELLFTSDVINALQTNEKTYTLNTAEHGAQGIVEIYSEKNKVNNKANALVVVELTDLKSNHYVGLKISAPDGTVHAWADDYWSYFKGRNVDGWVDGNSSYSAGEIGGTGKRIISVGAYASKESIINTAGTTTTLQEQTLNEIADFSSKGPTVDGRIKPDITAPGSILVSSFSGASATLNDYRFQTVSENVVGDKKYHYGAMQGTSMSAPYVTGVLAMWLQAKNDLTPEDVRSILSSASISDSYTGTIPTEGNTTWGYGKLDAWQGVKECLNMNIITDSIEVHGDIFCMPSIDDMKARRIPLRFLNQEAKNIKMHVYNMNGQRVFSKSFQNGTTYTSVDLSKLGGGVYIIKFEGDNLKAKNQRFILP